MLSSSSFLWHWLFPSPPHSSSAFSKDAQTNTKSAKLLLDVRPNSRSAPNSAERKLLKLAGPSALDFPEQLPMLPLVPLTRNALSMFPRLTMSASTSCKPLRPISINDSRSPSTSHIYIKAFHGKNVDVSLSCLSLW